MYRLPPHLQEVLVQYIVKVEDSRNASRLDSKHKKLLPMQYVIFDDTSLPVICKNIWYAYCYLSINPTAYEINNIPKTMAAAIPQSGSLQLHCAVTL